MFQVAHRGDVPPRPQVQSYPSSSPPSPPAPQPAFPRCPKCSRQLHGRVYLALSSWEPTPAAFVCVCGETLGMHVQVLTVTAKVNQTTVTRVSPHHPMHNQVRPPCACGQPAYGMRDTTCLEHVTQPVQLDLKGTTP